jgi:two-component system sensor histidine kinase DctS
MPLTSAPKPFQPSALEAPWKRTLWLLPMVLALAFVGLIAYWAEVNDANDRAAFQNTLVADSQSVEAQLIGRQDTEKAKLSEVARRISRYRGAGDAALQSLPEVVAGQDRLWNRLVWIDEDKRILARSIRPASAAIRSADGLQVASAVGQADHFVVAVRLPDGRPDGQLLARYEITDLLKSTDLAWLNRRYQVDFLSELGEVIATTANPARVPHGARYERPLAAFKDTTLRLTPYEPLAAWRKNSKTVALLAALLLLGAAASQLLRREMARVARAVRGAQTEAAWRQSMEDSALVGLRARDPSGRILYVNKTLCDIVGYSREALVGLMPPLPFWPPDATDAMMARNQNTLAGQSSADGFESRWRHQDGRMVDVMVFESPLLDSTGAPIGWMGSIIDISARKALEEKERRHVEAMAQHARLNDLGLIASELAHELNQPLTTITSYSAGLNIALKKQLPQATDLLAAVDAMHRSAKKAGDIVNWIRRQSSRSEPVRRECDLNALLTESVAQRQRQIARNHIQVHWQLDPALPRVWLDRIGVEQLISNLLRNAGDALAETDGVRNLWLQTCLVAGTDAGPGRVRLAVRDNGPGLQGRTIDMLCSTFYSTKANGMGLGLGICRAIAESHGGELSAHDAPCGGAEFCFSLPLPLPLPAAIQEGPVA